MSVSFNVVPSDLRVPIYAAEIDNSQASYYTQALRSLLVGQIVSSSTAVPGVPVLVSRSDEALTLFGQGSMLARMHQLYRANDPFGEMWCLPLADPSAGAAASGAVLLYGQRHLVWHVKPG